ncbi:MAG: hypothetical protein QNL61_11420 [Crocinitomicaceae bacterium]|jgi:hypothetical protein
MDLKKIASVAFGIAFLMAIVLFTGNGRSYISIPVAKMIFIIAGAIGLFLNLLSFRTGKNGSVFSFLYWAGSLIVFLGLIFLLMHWPYGYYIVIAGMAVLGISFIVPEKIIEQGKNDSDLLDDLNN